MPVEKREALYNDHRDKTFALGSADFKKHGPVYLVPPAITYRQPSRNFASGSRRAFWRIIPILTSEIHRYATNQANNTEQGLGATLRSPQGNLVPAQEIAERLEAGSLWVHRSAYPMPTAFFGGIEQSSVGGRVETAWATEILRCEDISFCLGEGVGLDMMACWHRDRLVGSGM